MKIEKNKVYTSKPGETIKLVTGVIQRNLSKSNKPKRKYKRIEKLKSGKFRNSDLKYLNYALQFMDIVGKSSLDNLLKKLGNREDLTKNQAQAITTIRLAKDPIFECI